MIIAIIFFYLFLPAFIGFVVAMPFGIAMRSRGHLSTGSGLILCSPVLSVCLVVAAILSTQPPEVQLLNDSERDVFVMSSVRGSTDPSVVDLMKVRPGGIVSLARPEAEEPCLLNDSVRLIGLPDDYDLTRYRDEETRQRVNAKPPAELTDVHHVFFRGQCFEKTSTWLGWNGTTLQHITAPRFGMRHVAMIAIGATVVLMGGGYALDRRRRNLPVPPPPRPRTPVAP